jgi:hypothetical protein
LHESTTNFFLSAPSEANSSRVTFEKEESEAKPLFLKKLAPQRIENICSVIGHPEIYKSCLHVRAEGGKLWKLAVGNGTDDLLLSDQTPIVTLKMLLESAQKLSKKQKSILAVILAYSLLYLSESSWLGREWTKDDVCFCYSADKGVDVGRPYLSAEFAAPGSLATADEETHVAPSLLGFGIILIELETGKPIESFWTEEDLDDGKKNPYSNRTAAYRLVAAEEEWDVYQRIRRAASACILRTFLTTNPGACETELSFQQAIYSNVVAPLEQELLHGYSITVDMLEGHLYHPIFEVRHGQKSSTNPHVPRERTHIVPSSTFIASQEINLPDEDSDCETEGSGWLYDSTVLSVSETEADKEK